MKRALVALVVGCGRGVPRCVRWVAGALAWLAAVVLSDDLADDVATWSDRDTRGVVQ